ncbi:MAG: carboxypeptidase regulatory-like domain-containing protein [Terriglobia bacterium]
MRFLISILVSFFLAPARLAHSADVPLKLLISVESPVIVAPYPVQLTLHIHNAGRESVWLYRRARSVAANGSQLIAHIEPADTAAGTEGATPAQGRVFENVGLPRPKLVRLPPDDDITEKTVLDIIPSHASPEGKGPPIWGRYRLSVTYRANYTNAEEIRRNLGVTLWQGEVTSNTIEIELQPPSGQGTISGTVQSQDGRLILDALVSLSDGEERLMGQTTTDSQGRYTFTELPFGTYWVTVRRPTFDEDTAVFRHLDVTAGAPDATLDFALSPPEIYEAQRLLHKPVLFLVTDTNGQSLEKVSLEITWSNGVVLEDVKAETGADGIAVIELIPGRSFVTTKRRGCPKQDDRADVAAGSGVDGFKLIYECEKK